MYSKCPVKGQLTRILKKTRNGTLASKIFRFGQTVLENRRFVVLKVA